MFLKKFSLNPLWPTFPFCFRLTNHHTQIFLTHFAITLFLSSLSLPIYISLLHCLHVSLSLYVTCVYKCLFHSLSLSRIYLIPFLRNFLKSMVCEPGCARMIQYLEPSPRIITHNSLPTIYKYKMFNIKHPMLLLCIFKEHLCERILFCDGHTHI